MDLFAQTIETTSFEVTTLDAGTTVAIGGFFFVWMFIIWFIYIIAFWKVFEKAGEPGWKSIVPIYNMWVMFEIAGRPGWWLLLMFIPLVNFVVAIILALDMAKVFGKSSAFGIVGLWLFSFIGYLILGWGDATYTKPGGQAPAPVQQ